MGLTPEKLRGLLPRAAWICATMGPAQAETVALLRRLHAAASSMRDWCPQPVDLMNAAGTFVPPAGANAMLNAQLAVYDNVLAELDEVLARAHVLEHVITPTFAAQFSPLEHARILVLSYPRLPQAPAICEAILQAEVTA